jgi:hypothetical protein
MKALINNTTGEILQYFKVLRSEQKVVYRLYANGLLYNQQIAKEDGMLPLNLETVCPNPSTYDQFMEYIGVETLKQSFQGFTESEENWVFETGSTGLTTTVRVFIPSDLFTKVMYTGEPLDLLIQAMSPLKDWTTRNDAGIVQYLEELLPEHRGLLEMYVEQGVLIEDKEV